MFSYFAGGFALSALRPHWIKSIAIFYLFCVLLLFEIYFVQSWPKRTKPRVTLIRLHECFGLTALINDLIVSF